MKKLLKVMSISLAVFTILSFCGIAQAVDIEETVTRTYRVENESELPQEITFEGGTYQLSEYDLEPIKEMIPQEDSRTFSKTVRYNNLQEEKADFQTGYEVTTADGYKGPVYKVSEYYTVDTEHSIFERNVEFEETIEHGFLNETPYVEPYIEKDLIDEATGFTVRVQIPLVSTELQAIGWREARSAKFTFQADKDGRYYMPVSKKFLNINDAAPGEEYSDDILSMIGLEAEHYRVAGVVWESEIVSNGTTTMRTANYALEEKEMQYVSTYATVTDVPKITRYSGFATYEGTLTKMIDVINPDAKYTATVKYSLVSAPPVVVEDAPVEAEPVAQVIDDSPAPLATIADEDAPLSPWPFVIGSAAAAAAIIAVIFLVKRRKNVIVSQEVGPDEYDVYKKMRVSPSNPVIDLSDMEYAGTIKVAVHKSLIDKTDEKIEIVLSTRTEFASTKYDDSGYAETYVKNIRGIMMPSQEYENVGSAGVPSYTYSIRGNSIDR